MVQCNWKLHQLDTRRVKKIQTQEKLFFVNRLVLKNSSFSGANILDVLNSNSQLVAQEFGGPILDYAIDYAMNVTQKFFNTYTYDQISHVPLTDEFFEKS